MVGLQTLPDDFFYFLFGGVKEIRFLSAADESLIIGVMRIEGLQGFSGRLQKRLFH